MTRFRAPRAVLSCAAGLLAGVFGCGSPSGKASSDECKNSICGSGASSSQSSGGSGQNGGASQGAGASSPGAGAGQGAGGASGGAGATGSGGSAPLTGPIAALDMGFYKCNVEPIFDRSCSMLGCHGTEERPFRMYARGRLRNDEMIPGVSSCLRSGDVNLAEMGTATVMCEGWTPHTATEWQKNFDSANYFMREGMQPEDSELLAQATVGGLPHVGVHPFKAGDENYEMVKRWLSGEQLGSVCDPLPN